MAKPKRKLSPKQKAGKARLLQEYMWIFIHGKQKRVRRPPTIDGMDVDEYIRLNADPLWLHQEGLWEYLLPEDEVDATEQSDAWVDFEVLDAQSVGDLA
jgi:hypothetical protein